MTDKRQQLARIAFRVEGDWWNAYFCGTENMKGAVLLGSVRMSAVRYSPATKSAFMVAMRSVVDAGIKSVLGQDGDWAEPVPAPQSERAGSA